ncbi:MAG: hypothetical protein GW942_01460 [Candidatus Pacebacteria bacterium]|nr:hypothetical protein [Candidatus Paceibacterota bacterium]
MPKEINFIQGRRKKLTKDQKNDFKIFKIASTTFAILIATFLITLGLDFFLKFQVKNAQEKQIDMEKQVLAKESVEQSIVIATEKLKILSELFEQRYDKQASINYFSNVFGPEVLIKDINYEANERILSLRLQSQSIFVLEEVFLKLSDPEVEAQFGNINKSELIRNDKGGYNMAITLSLSETDLQK